MDKTYRKDISIGNIEVICILLSVGSHRDDRSEFHIHRWYPFLNTLTPEKVMSLLGPILRDHFISMTTQNYGRSKVIEKCNIY